jgi:hypothetical protein
LPEPLVEIHLNGVCAYDFAVPDDSQYDGY